MTDKSKEKGTLPLRERRQDILSFAAQYIKLAAEQIGTEIKVLSSETEEYLATYDWPGDEKELETAIKKACILSEGPELEVEDFDLKHRQVRSIGKFVESKLKGFMRNIKRFEAFNLYDMVIPEVEKSLIMMVLNETRGNQIRAASLLGINRNTLRSKIRKLGIKARDSKY